LCQWRFIVGNIHIYSRYSGNVKIRFIYPALSKMPRALTWATFKKRKVIPARSIPWPEKGWVYFYKEI